MAEIQVRPMQKQDVLQCTRVHLQAFQGFFLTYLGPRFLTELYSSIICDPTGISFVVEGCGKPTGGQSQILGFVVGTTSSSGLYTRLLRRRFLRFAWASIGAFLKKPAILPRLLRAFNMPSERIPVSDCGTLMSISVHPDAQCQGVGRLLVRAFLDEASRRGVEHVNLTTDCVGNDGVNRFYRSLGFTLLRTYTTPEGRQMNEYVIALPNSHSYIEKQTTVPSSATSALPG